MKRYDGYILRFINHEGGATQQEPAEVYLASETDETIMNMVDEFAETAKDYEADRAKDREEIESLKRKNELLIQTIEHSKEEIARLIESYNKAVDPLEQDVKRLNVEIARLRNALEQIERGCSFPEDEVQKAIVKIAREALEGK